MLKVIVKQLLGLSIRNYKTNFNNSANLQLNISLQNSYYVAIFKCILTLYRYTVCKKGNFVMTNSFFNPQPSYSGVTIQIANPAVNVNPNGAAVTNGQVLSGAEYYNGYINPNPLLKSDSPSGYYCNNAGYLPSKENGVINGEKSGENISAFDEQNTKYNKQNGLNAYPAQYYLNNYNYGINGNGNSVPKTDSNYSEEDKYGNSERELNKIVANNSVGSTPDFNSQPYDNKDHSMNSYKIFAASNENAPTDMSTSKNIIEDIDEREAKLEEEKKNSKETRIVALTDEYIKSLENYLDNPNDEIRLMAAKEILTRLDEDKERYNDAALNALLNKMMQDPSKLVRIAALSAFASQLASGNDYTVQLLHNIQSNPNSDKEDILQAADILLKMSAGVEVKNIPNPNKKDNSSK